MAAATAAPGSPRRRRTPSTADPIRPPRSLPFRPRRDRRHPRRRPLHRRLAGARAIAMATRVRRARFVLVVPPRSFSAPFHHQCAHTRRVPRLHSPISVAASCAMMAVRGMTALATRPLQLRHAVCVLFATAEHAHHQTSAKARPGREEPSGFAAANTHGFRNDVTSVHVCDRARLETPICGGHGWRQQRLALCTCTHPMFL